MNLKRLISSQKIRHRILKLASFIPDKWMVMMQYHIVFSRWPNLKHPKRFTEWIQWYKIYYRNPDMLKCADKYHVRDYVRKKIGEKYLIPLYSVTKSAAEINFDNLPTKFVIKTTDGGGGDNVLIVKDKSTLNLSETIKRVNSWKGKKYYIVSREWAYRGASQPLIIIEKYLECSDSLNDYKFFCFNGKVEYFKIDFDRFTSHRANYYDRNLTLLPFNEMTYTRDEHRHLIPDNIMEMFYIAERLAADFSFARIDLYNVDGRIYFGEITFYPGSGYCGFDTDEADIRLGNYFNQINFTSR